MFKKLSIGFLILSFGLSGTNVGLADQAIEIPPVIVEPYNTQGMQMLDQDRKNRDQEFAIKQLIEKNDQLAQASLSHQQDQGLAAIDQTMLGYRDSLYARDQARIFANSEHHGRYGDLIVLTEDADSMTVHHDLEDESGMLAQKYQMLTALKDEMTALNDRLTNKEHSALDEKQATIDGFKKIAQEQQDKILMLVKRLDETDKRIAHLEDLLEQKEQQIVQLKNRLSDVQSEASSKDETIKEQQDQIAILENKPKLASVSADGISAVAPIIVNPSNNQPTVNNQELTAKDEIIKAQKDQIEILENETKVASAASNGTMAMAPIPVNNQELAAKDALINVKQGQVDLLKSELEDKVTLIKQQQVQIDALKDQAGQLSTKLGIMGTQAESLNAQSQQLKSRGAAYAVIQNRLAALKHQMESQAADLKAKDESIRWLNQVLSVTKNKAKYYQLISQQDRLSLQQVQAKVQDIKKDFSIQLKDYDQFESSIVSLKDQVGHLSVQLSSKQSQVDLLKSQLDTKIAQEKDQTQLEQDLKSQLAEKENQIASMQADIRDLQAKANEEDKVNVTIEENQHMSNDHMKLAKQLIGLQNEEASLIDEKSGLEEDGNTIFDRRFAGFEKNMKVLLAQRNIYMGDLQNRLQELQDQLTLKEGQADALQAELKNKIAQEKDQTVLAAQIQDLNSQLKDKENQIDSMNTKIREGQQSTEEVDSLKRKLVWAQDQAAQLKQELDNKTEESNKMTLLTAGYQKKLESKNNAYNTQLKSMLSFKTIQALMGKQIDELNARLQEKETQVVKIKKNMYDLRESIEAKDMDLQSKDLSLAMVQQKMTDDKIKEYQDKINGLQAMNDNQIKEIKSLKTQLALSTEQLNGMPSSDELNFLRTGLKKATDELQQKSQLLLQTKANADEYQKEYDEQSKGFQSLKEQLAEAQEQLERRDEDLKYKNLAIIRLKEIAKKNESDLKAQVEALTQRLTKPHHLILHRRHISLISRITGNKVEVLKAQLENANEKIRSLQDQIDQLESMSKPDAQAAKLKQALDKIIQQGKIISVLAQKLQDTGHGVDLTKYSN